MTIAHRVKQLFSEPDADGPYRCRSCGQRFELDRQSCSRCDSHLIERMCYDELLSVD